MNRLETTLITLEETKQSLLREIRSLRIEERIRWLAEQEITLHALAAQRYMQKMYGRAQEDIEDDSEDIFERSSGDPTDMEMYRSRLERLRYHLSCLKNVPAEIKRNGARWKPILAYDPATARPHLMYSKE